MVGVNYHFLFEGIVGNVGGLKFCRWYGFSGRVEWCACFISWCANQCGYIEKGIIPKFAAVGDGVPAYPLPQSSAKSAKTEKDKKPDAKPTATR